MHNKGNYKQGEKTALRLGENNSKWSKGQIINLKNIQATPAAQFQKNKRPSQKVGQQISFLRKDETEVEKCSTLFLDLCSLKILRVEALVLWHKFL